MIFNFVVFFCDAYGKVLQGISETTDVFTDLLKPYVGV